MSIFGVAVRPHLMHQAVVMQLNNRRAGAASTKTRGLVRGSGRKPWRQKGSGRARAGSVRSPIWVGGGRVFGPLPRDYSYRIPKKARRQDDCPFSVESGATGAPMPTSPGTGCPGGVSEEGEELR